MMKHSAVMFSSPSQARTQTFHLNSNYSVSWVDSDIVDPSSGSGVVVSVILKIMIMTIAFYV